MYISAFTANDQKNAYQRPDKDCVEVIEVYSFELDRDYVDVIGVCGIQIGDSFETVLRKLGFQNADLIKEQIQKNGVGETECWYRTDVCSVSIPVTVGDEPLVLLSLGYYDDYGHYRYQAHTLDLFFDDGNLDFLRLRYDKF